MLKFTSAVFLLSLVAVGDASAQRGGGGGGRGGRTQVEPKPPYAVVQVGDELMVCAKNQVAGLRQQLSRTYSREVKDYQSARQEAKRNKTDFRDAKPERKKIKVLSSSHKTPAAANEYLEKFLARARKKKPDTELRRGDAVAVGGRGRGRGAAGRGAGGRGAAGKGGKADPGKRDRKGDKGRDRQGKKGRDAKGGESGVGK